MKAVFLGVGALEVTAAIFRVGVFHTRRQHIAEFLQPICAMTGALFHIVFRVTMTKRPARIFKTLFISGYIPDNEYS
jgi:hypothetical protein